MSGGNPRRGHRRVARECCARRARPALSAPLHSINTVRLRENRPSLCWGGGCADSSICYARTRNSIQAESTIESEQNNDNGNEGTEIERAGEEVQSYSSAIRSQKALRRRRRRLKVV
ncbi:hypothetical protein EVAR_34652_1 [Eumeta japonica]|uniref:Uncharacterized protein n=1 Tax=Eumeta variegata TaxID=151549 RepID=A0A4C1VIS5_EUMVA|nr:hypothetical protein EVAR_34652_1 [Eumeta japonica]